MADLERRVLGRTELPVTTLGYGAMELRGVPGWPVLDDDQVERLLNAVLDGGINYIDTSIDYGISEERLGRFLSYRRNEFWLASKCGCVPGAGQGAEHVHTAANIRAGVEESLRRLQTDHLDLVQFHRSLTPEEFDAEGGLSEVVKMRDEGKVRFIGVSGTLPNIDAQIDMGTFDVFQIPYSAMQPEHQAAIHRASQAGAGVVIRGGVARGVPDDWEGHHHTTVPSDVMQERWERGRLDDLLDGMTRTAFMLRFTLSDPDLDTTIVGTANIDHLQANIAAAGRGPLPPDVIAEVKRRLT